MIQGAAILNLQLRVTEHEFGFKEVFLNMYLIGNSEFPTSKMRFCGTINFWLYVTNCTFKQARISTETLMRR